MTLPMTGVGPSAVSSAPPPSYAYVVTEAGTVAARGGYNYATSFTGGIWDGDLVNDAGSVVMRRTGQERWELLEVVGETNGATLYSKDVESDTPPLGSWDFNYDLQNQPDAVVSAGS